MIVSAGAGDPAVAVAPHAPSLGCDPRGYEYVRPHAPRSGARNARARGGPGGCRTAGRGAAGAPGRDRGSRLRRRAGTTTRPRARYRQRAGGAGAPVPCIWISRPGRHPGRGGGGRSVGRVRCRAARTRSRGRGGCCGPACGCRRTAGERRRCPCGCRFVRCPRSCRRGDGGSSAARRTNHPGHPGDITSAEPRVADAVAALRTHGCRSVSIATYLLAPGMFTAALQGAGQTLSQRRLVTIPRWWR